MGCVTIQNRGISIGDGVWMVHDDNLSGKINTNFGRIIFGIRAYKSSSHILNGDSFNIEPNVISRLGLFEFFMMHFDGFDFSGDIRGREFDNHSFFQNSGLDSSDGNSSDSRDLIDILKRKSQWFVIRSFGDGQFVDSF